MDRDDGEKEERFSALVLSQKYVTLQILGSLV